MSQCTNKKGNSPEYVNHVMREGRGMSDENDTILQFQDLATAVPHCLLFAKLVLKATNDYIWYIQNISSMQTYQGTFRIGGLSPDFDKVGQLQWITLPENDRTQCRCGLRAIRSLPSCTNENGDQSQARLQPTTVR